VRTATSGARKLVTFGAISGTNWIALAPLPMTATRLPVIS
jgi:hypothetical protein